MNRQAGIIFLSVLWCTAASSADTTFVRLDATHGITQSIFIVRDAPAAAYAAVTDFGLPEYQRESAIRQTAMLEKITGTPGVAAASSLPKKWIELHKYKGAFYAYKPCDCFTEYKIAFDGTMMIVHRGDGPALGRVTSRDQVDSVTCKISLLWPDNTPSSLNIHLLNPHKGLAVFETPAAPGGQAHYRLMVSAEQAQNYPLIVNRCTKHKQRELPFDTPDFARLLAESNRGR